MTNAMIILAESVRLMEEGKIGTTGRYIVVQDAEGNEKRLMEPEAIHTFQGWKSRGYIVRKGEHAIASFTIWKYKSGKSEIEDDGKAEKSRIFMKHSHFFSAAQVEKMI